MSEWISVEERLPPLFTKEDISAMEKRWGKIVAWADHGDRVTFQVEPAPPETSND